MSTSSITGIMSHVYWLVSNFKNPHFNNLSYHYDYQPQKFMISQRKPDSIYLRKIDNEQNIDIYAIDADQGFVLKQNIVLMNMGKTLERLLVSTPKEFEKYKLGSILRDKTPDGVDYYNYSRLG